MHDQPDDERITRLLAAVRAEAEPALWTRVRARIEERERGQARGWVAWLMRPAVLGGSLALLAVAIATSLALVATAPQTSGTTTAETLEDALVVELESGVTAGGAAAPSPGAATDSGASR
jgi:hypothetical protein